VPALNYSLQAIGLSDPIGPQPQDSTSPPGGDVMSEETLRRQLYESFANRAHIYHLLFSQLRAELGAEKAAEVMGRAIYQRGVQNAARYASFATRYLEGLGRAFLANLPDDGAMFGPEVVRCDPEGLDIKFHRCPLKQAWLDVGLAPEEVAALCHRVELP
jgi:hypothetical protein